MGNREGARAHPAGSARAGATGVPLLIAAWTLQYEVAFNLVLAAFIANRALGIAVVAALVSNATWCAVHTCGLYTGFLASEYALHFAVGGVAASLAGRVPRPPKAW